MSKKKVLLRGVFINRDTNGEGVLKVGTTLIRVSTVMGILYNFIIFPEYDDGEGGIQIPFSLSIYKNSLLDAINSYAQEKGVI